MAITNPRSTAQLGGHPIHPMLIPFPIVFFISTFACDLIYLATRSPVWATAALWLLGAGIVMSAFAAITGAMDYFGDDRIRRLSDARQHAIGNVVAVVLAVANWLWRYTQDVGAVLPLGLLLSAAVAGILLFTAWKGGNLVYRDGVGVRNSH